MNISLDDVRRINILVDENQNIVIFPLGKAPPNAIDAEEGKYRVAYYPIELKAPYMEEELADKIQQGLDEWGKHEGYNDFSGKNTFEEKYYCVDGFKNAVRGKRLIHLGWDDYGGKTISLSLPCKRGYAYLGVKTLYLSDDSDCRDFAKGVLELIHTDLDQLEYYRRNKSKLNI